MLEAAIARRRRRIGAAALLRFAVRDRRRKAATAGRLAIDRAHLPQLLYRAVRAAHVPPRCAQIRRCVARPDLVTAGSGRWRRAQALTPHPGSEATRDAREAGEIEKGLTPPVRAAHHCGISRRAVLEPNRPPTVVRGRIRRGAGLHPAGARHRRIARVFRPRTLGWPAIGNRLSLPVPLRSDRRGWWRDDGAAGDDREEGERRETSPTPFCPHGAEGNRFLSTEDVNLGAAEGGRNDPEPPSVRAARPDCS